MKCIPKVRQITLGIHFINLKYTTNLYASKLPTTSGEAVCSRAYSLVNHAASGEGLLSNSQSPAYTLNAIIIRLKSLSL